MSFSSKLMYQLSKSISMNAYVEEASPTRHGRGIRGSQIFRYSAVSHAAAAASNSTCLPFFSWRSQVCTSIFQAPEVNECGCWIVCLAYARKRNKKVGCWRYRYRLRCLLLQMNGTHGPGKNHTSWNSSCSLARRRGKFGIERMAMVSQSLQAKTPCWFCCSDFVSMFSFGLCCCNMQCVGSLSLTFQEQKFQWQVLPRLARPVAKDMPLLLMPHINVDNKW